MGKQYAVVAFPEIELIDRVERIRGRFDPMAVVLGAHVTLVFPFRSTVTQLALEQHIRRTIAGFQPFSFNLDSPVADGMYVFLNVAGGTSAFSALHDRLYTDVLAPHLSSTHAYVPHLTIGLLPTPESARDAAREAAAMLPPQLPASVRSLSLFRLEHAGSGQVARSFPLS